MKDQLEEIKKREALREEFRRYSLYELFAEVDSEGYRSSSQIIHTILRKLNELVFQKDSRTCH